jgi:hypothetical protein
MKLRKFLVIAVACALAFGAGFYFTKKVSMSEGLTFLGEFELAEAPLHDPSFADFVRLPYIEAVRSLAAEFAGAIELMPFQKDGDGMRILVSVYLQPKNSTGKVIAVLIRAPYPNDLISLSGLVDKAATRLPWLASISDRFEQSSILAAEESLSRLSRRIKEVARLSQNKPGV